MDTLTYLLESRRYVALDFANAVLMQAVTDREVHANPIDLFSLWDVQHGANELVATTVALSYWTGASWDAIGGWFGCSRQAAHKRFGATVNELLDEADRESVGVSSRWQGLHVEERPRRTQNLVQALVDDWDSELVDARAVWRSRKRVKRGWWLPEDSY